MVPADHFYRQPKEKLGLSFVRGVRDCCKEIGRPSIDPLVFFRFHLIGSERRLTETAI